MLISDQYESVTSHIWPLLTSHIYKQLTYINNQRLASEAALQLTDVNNCPFLKVTKLTTDRLLYLVVTTDDLFSSKPACLLYIVRIPEPWSSLSSSRSSRYVSSRALSFLSLISALLLLGHRCNFLNLLFLAEHPDRRFSMINQMFYQKKVYVSLLMVH